MKFGHSAMTAARAEQVPRGLRWSELVPVGSTQGGGGGEKQGLSPRGSTRVRGRRGRAWSSHVSQGPGRSAQRGGGRPVWPSGPRLSDPCGAVSRGCRDLTTALLAWWPTRRGGRPCLRGCPWSRLPRIPPVSDSSDSAAVSVRSLSQSGRRARARARPELAGAQLAAPISGDIRGWGGDHRRVKDRSPPRDSERRPRSPRKSPRASSAERDSGQVPGHGALRAEPSKRSSVRIRPPVVAAPGRQRWADRACAGAAATVAVSASECPLSRLIYLIAAWSRSHGSVRVTAAGTVRATRQPQRRAGGASESVPTASRPGLAQSLLPQTE